jgi:hypothetical protein
MSVERSTPTFYLGALRSPEGTGAYHFAATEFDDNDPAASAIAVTSLVDVCGSSYRTSERGLVSVPVEVAEVAIVRAALSSVGIIKEYPPIIANGRAQQWFGPDGMDAILRR